VYEAITGQAIVFSFQGLLVASSLQSAVRRPAVRRAFAAVDRNLIETAWCLGASRARTSRGSLFHWLDPVSSPAWS